MDDSLGMGKMVTEFLSLSTQLSYLESAANFDDSDGEDVLVLKNEKQKEHDLMIEREEWVTKLQGEIKALVSEHFADALADLNEHRELSKTLEERNRREEEYDGWFGKTGGIIPVQDLADNRDALLVSLAEAERSECEDALVQLQEDACRSAAESQCPAPDATSAVQRPFEMKLFGCEGLEWDEAAGQLVMTLKTEAEDVVRLRLRLHPQDPSWLVSSIQFEDENPQLEEWAADVVLPIHLVSVLLRLREKMRCPSPLLAEIEDLRHSFGLDWIPEERKLLVILDGGSQATLQVAEDYPKAGSLALLGIKGRDVEAADVAQLLPQGKTRLTDYLSHLTEAFARRKNA